MNTSKKLSLGPIGSYFEFPYAGFHPTPEGWVRPLGVEPRVPHHVSAQMGAQVGIFKGACKEDSLTAQKADQIMIRPMDVLETV